MSLVKQSEASDHVALHLPYSSEYLSHHSFKGHGSPSVHWAWAGLGGIGCYLLAEAVPIPNSSLLSSLAALAALAFEVL